MRMSLNSGHDSTRLAPTPAPQPRAVTEAGQFTHGHNMRRSTISAVVKHAVCLSNLG